MNLYKSITQRKSCREYDMSPLEKDALDEIEDVISKLKPLYSNVPIQHRYTQKIKGMLGAEAPHYLILSGSGAKGEKENAGFIFQQLALWFDANNIGCIWLGGAKAVQKNITGNDIVVIAFGHTKELVHRTTLDEFKRKPISEITNAPDDKCIKASHLAPSGMNTQPWFFEKNNGKVNVYQKKPKPPISLFYKLTDLDMGIALCHYALACENSGKIFAFKRADELPAKTGFAPFGIISDQE